MTRPCTVKTLQMHTFILARYHRTTALWEGADAPRPTLRGGACYLDQSDRQRAFVECNGRADSVREYRPRDSPPLSWMPSCLSLIAGQSTSSRVLGLREDDAMLC